MKPKLIRELEQRHAVAAKRSEEVSRLLAYMLMGGLEGKDAWPPIVVKLAEKLYAELMPKTYFLPPKRQRKK